MRTVEIDTAPGYFIREDGLVTNSGFIRGGGEVKVSLNHASARGYPCVHLRIDGRFHRVRLHRLLAQAFIPNPNNYPLVLHKDDNRKNYNLDNLEWGTYSMNIRQRWNGRH